MNFIIYLFLLLTISQLITSETNLKKRDPEKIRVCIVEGRGLYRKASKFCPIIEQNTNIECVIGVDRLDCVRRIHKGTAHFGVFSSEDLVAARWASAEILVTNEMRFHDTPFEYEIVAVVDNEADIHTAHDLRGSRFCHPGYGLENHWTEVLANYFESVLVQKSCDADLSLTEARIKATANFFGPTCKAGPWVPDPVQDRILKTRYPRLCQLCYDSYRCDIGDKHWGRRGTLYCLTSGSGEVAWARLDDVKSHFGFSGIPPSANPNEYSYLCPDGHLQPLNSTRPCVWVAKPWPAVAAKRSHAKQIQEIISQLSHNENTGWQSALLSLIESYYVSINTLDNTIPVEDYLEQAEGFKSAYSFPECNPPRSIVYCTTSIIQYVKCSWLQEAAQVYGITPNLQCIRMDSLKTCLESTQYGEAHVVMVDQDTRIQAQRDYNLIPLLYEFSKEMHERYVTIAVIKKNSKFKTFTDLKNQKICLPSYEGAAYISVLNTIRNLTHHNDSLLHYFSSKSCTWNPKNPNNNNYCPDKYRGENGALECLLNGHGDVAFISSDIFNNLKNHNNINSTENWMKDINSNDLDLLCPYGQNGDKSSYEFCYLHWTTRGHLMIHNSTLIRHNEIYNSLRDMDRLFGKYYKESTIPFAMFGPFDKRSNVLFRDNTDGLRGITEIRKDKEKRLLENVYLDYSLGLYPNHVNQLQITTGTLVGLVSAIILLNFCI